MKMFRSLQNKLLKLYHDVVSSIAFYPSLILLFFFLLAVSLLSIDNNKMTNWMIEHFPYLVIDNADTARSLLATMIGGLISMMVFSFSMVMMILNQASTNFSPRLLPGLVSDKRNQLVLGTYLGTIVYNALILMSVLPDGDKYTLNGFSILLGMIFAMSCLFLFIYFIHTVSTGIQINNILDGIFIETKNRLNLLLEKERMQTEIPDVNEDHWKYIKSEKAGYFQGVNTEGLKDLCQEQEMNIRMLVSKGQYLLPNQNIAGVDKKLDEEECSDLREYFRFSNSTKVDDNYVLGIKQITEVGVKAMSPGINDPGTAIMTIDYLTELLALRMKLSEAEIYAHKDSPFTLQMKPVEFEDLIYHTLAAYRQYCKHDIILMKKLVSMLNYLKDQDVQNKLYTNVIEDQLNIIKEDIDQNINNSFDRENLSEL